MTRFGLSGTDVAGMSMLAEVAESTATPAPWRGQPPRAWRGLPMDYYAYPTVGLPSYKPISPWPIDKSVVYSIARTESNFNQQDVSSANAVGLMQVTPEAGRDTARRFHVKYDWHRMRTDPVYNMQMGAAEVANDLHYYRGSYLLTFAAYNAGFGRVKQWIAAFRRSARPARRSDRLGRAHPARRDAQLRAAGDGEPAGLSRPLPRQQQAADRSRSQARRQIADRSSCADLPLARRHGARLAAAMPYTVTMRIEPKSVFLSAADGLRLHARVYGKPTAPRPAGGLPARTCAHRGRLRGAGHRAVERQRAIRATWWRSIIAAAGNRTTTATTATTRFRIELADVLAVITALDCMPAVFVGTSRGGLLAMLLAALRPSAIAGVVLNDIGPVIDPQGLMRIKSYIGKLPTPRDYEEGAEILRRMFGAQFPKLGPADWLAAAHRTFKEEKGRLVPTYDVRLAATLEGFDLERPLPPLWKEFDALARFPLLVIRGANSDLLTPETVAAMRARRRAMDVHRSARPGPRAAAGEPDVIARIGEFVRGCER